MKDYCYSLDEESYFDRDHINDEIESGVLMDADTITTMISRGESVPRNHRDFIHVDHILENIGEAAYDVGGEWADDYVMDVSCFDDEDAKKELAKLISDWLDVNVGEPTFYGVENITKVAIIIGDQTNNGGVIFFQPYGSLTREQVIHENRIS